MTTFSNGIDAAAMKNPTNPDLKTEPSTSSTQLDSTLMAATHQLNNHLLAGGGSVAANHGLANNGILSSGIGYSESNYEVFDPLNWMLDGLVDFPYSYAAVQGLETNGMG